MFVVVTYDIADDRRLRRVATVMKDYGARVQRSVFECRIGDRELAGLIEKLKVILKKKEDRVHIYHLCVACQQRFDEYGQGQLLADVDVLIC